MATLTDFLNLSDDPNWHTSNYSNLEETRQSAKVAGRPKPQGALKAEKRTKLDILPTRKERVNPNWQRNST